VEAFAEVLENIPENMLKEPLLSKVYECLKVVYTTNDDAMDAKDVKEMAKRAIKAMQAKWGVQTQ